MKLLASGGGPRIARTVSEQGMETESRKQRSESVELGDGSSMRMGWEGSEWRSRLIPGSGSSEDGSILMENTGERANSRAQREEFDASYAEWGASQVTRRCKRHELDPWVGKIPWRRKWQLTQVRCLSGLKWSYLTNN